MSEDAGSTLTGTGPRGLLAGGGVGEEDRGDGEEDDEEGGGGVLVLHHLSTSLLPSKLVSRQLPSLPLCTRSGQD